MNDNALLATLALALALFLLMYVLLQWAISKNRNQSKGE